MESHKNNILTLLKDEIGRLFFISFGVFLFILFFQPFPLEMLDFNNRLLYVTGFGIIEFIMACCILVILPFVLPKFFIISEWESGPPVVLNFILLLFSATAFAFYIHYVGEVDLSIYILFKIFLICLIPLIILVIVYKNKSLEKVIDALKSQNNFYLQKLREYEQNGGEDQVEIVSDNKSDNLILKLKNLVFVRSADNYIEVYFLANDTIQKKLIRNTLKNIEVLLAEQKMFTRCHRTCLVNVLYIKKLVRDYNGYGLKINGLDEKLPVSRQYLEQVKVALALRP